jgi:hypothetical protein
MEVTQVRTSVGTRIFCRLRREKNIVTLRERFLACVLVLFLETTVSGPDGSGEPTEGVNDLEPVRIVRRERACRARAGRNVAVGYVIQKKERVGRNGTQSNQLAGCGAEVSLCPALRHYPRNVACLETDGTIPSNIPATGDSPCRTSVWQHKAWMGTTEKCETRLPRGVAMWMVNR